MDYQFIEEQIEFIDDFYFQEEVITSSDINDIEISYLTFQF